jgi:hypothetical protein
VSSLGDQFIDDLVAAMPTPEAQLRLLAALSKYEGYSVYLPLPKQAGRRARAAENMLQNDMSRADAAAAIKARFCVSMRTASRDVAEASRKMSSKNGRTARETDASTAKRSSS